MTAPLALEWDRFIHFAKKEAKSVLGAAKIEGLIDPTTWAKDVDTAQHLQRETNEAHTLLNKDALWAPLEGLEDPQEILERLNKGSVLQVGDLVALRRWLYAIDSWSQFPREESPGELFTKSIGSLMDPFEPLRILQNKITPEGEISERASPRLASIHQEIRSLQKEIDSVMDRVVKSLTQKGVLQDSFMDVREGRYVVPVRASAQSDVAGNIFDSSSSGHTVFIEPAEVGPLNNRLKQRKNDLLQEIFAILTEISERLRPFEGDLSSAVLVLAHWDAVQARARLGLRFSGHAIHVTSERFFRLPSTAHPLLWFSIPKDQIVRNTIEFGAPTKTLLITGPNTGGKTVLLKTLGLAGICARTGFPFPASDTVTVPFFSQFFADVGDPQSLENHLSSFSGHVLRFKEILENVNDSSLVLIDELNTATDPEEGAALGRAVLESLMDSGTITVTTTHDPHLKGLALNEPRIFNASMAFDETSRTPAFLLVPGVPGRSRALETAERLGIPEKVLALAKSYLSREHNLFETLLAKLESDSVETTRARKEAQSLRAEAEKLKKEWTERTGKAVDEMLDRTRQKLRRILDQAQDEVRTTVQKLSEMKSRREVDLARSGLSSSFQDSSKRIETALAEEAPDLAHQIALTPAPTSEPAKLYAYSVGESVKVPKWKNTATILEINGEKIKLAMGNLQMTLGPRDIEPLRAAEKEMVAIAKRSLQARREQVQLESVAAPGAQLDLRGVRFDEAMAELTQYLDQAFRSRAYKEVTIVHGLGTGALREGAHKLLKKVPYIKAYRDGGVGSGGAGATIVEFDWD